ncbi:MAG: CvpA family protein [Dehalococcoidia bacterium]|nr:MAG: CvpA family protein [Dehalococcoidia bacterium]
MHWLDIVILVALVITTLIGLKIGLIKAALSLAGLIVGVILAGQFYVPLAGQLTFIPQATVAKVVAFAIILLGVMIIASILARFLKWAASLMMLGWVNRLGGAIFGLVLGAILCGAFLAIWVKFLGAGDAIAHSGLANLLLARLPLVLGLLPGEFDSVRSFF